MTIRQFLHFTAIFPKRIFFPQGEQVSGRITCRLRGPGLGFLIAPNTLKTIRDPALHPAPSQLWFNQQSVIFIANIIFIILLLLTTIMDIRG